MTTDYAVIQESDVDGVRASAQWLLAGLGGIAVLVLAGLQVGDVWQVLANDGWRRYSTIAGCLALVVGGSALATAASRVLVPDRSNLTDLLTSSAQTDAEFAGIKMKGVQQSARTKALHEHLRAEVSRARGWLLPPGCNDLDELYQAFRSETDPSARLATRRVMAEVVSFARTEAAMRSYRALVGRLLGWAGGLTLGGLLVVALTAHAGLPTSQASPLVDQPIPVTVHFESAGDALEAHGIDPRCAGLSLHGVAVGGTLVEPLVLVESGQGCPRQRLTVGPEVGFALPS